MAGSEVPRTATIVGGGLAGSEAAWALANRGFKVALHEMRPVLKTPAHQTDRLAELVCSNSFKSVETGNAHGLLKAELRLLGSMLLECADEARVPGGAALVVDRDVFSRRAHERLEAHPNITIHRGEVAVLPEPGIVATGPLTSEQLGRAISERLGTGALAFYDAIAPIVSADSLNHEVLYALSRYGKGEGTDYLNAPMSPELYEQFIDGLIAGDQYHGHEFDEVPYFEGCLPVEEMASRGRETLRFGPMKPVGLPDPRTGRDPWAVVQLRREDKAGQMWNLVGFQTRLRIPEQQKVFRTGIMAGINLAGHLDGKPPVVPPPTTMLGALYRYLRDADPKHFQPMNANFGLLDPLPGKVKKDEKKMKLAERALADFATWMKSL